MQLLDEVVTGLVEKGTLPAKNKPHKLTGNYKGFWECHIQPDWLLIWEQHETIKLITLTRTGHTAIYFKQRFSSLGDNSTFCHRRGLVLVEISERLQSGGRIAGAVDATDITESIKSEKCTNRGRMSAA